MQTPIRQKRSHVRIPYFCRFKYLPCTVPPRADALFRPLSRHHREEDAENAGGKIPD